jgi:molybdopterin molybdotransferase
MSAPRARPEPIALAEPVKFGRSMSSFLPVAVSHDERGQVRAVPRFPNGPGDFLALAGTQGFVELPPRAEEFPAGYVASLYRW